MVMLYASWLIAAQLAFAPPSSSPAVTSSPKSEVRKSEVVLPACEDLDLDKEVHRLRTSDLGHRTASATGQSAVQPPSQQGQSTSKGSTDNQSVDDIVSIDRIRKALERAPTLTFIMPDPNVPRFRVEISGNQFRPLNFQNSFYIPPTPAPVPFGGVDYYEMQRLNTPPEFWGSAPFTNKDLLGMAALNGAYSLLGALIKKGIEAQAIAEQVRFRREVQEELRALAEHNARIAAEQEKKKKEEKK